MGKYMLAKLYPPHKEIIWNFFWRSLQIVGKQGTIFLIFIICAKLLTPYDFGIYNYVLGIVFFLIVFGDFGISIATSKYVVEYNITNKEKLKSVLFNSGLIIFILAVLISILIFAFGNLFLSRDKFVYILYLLPLIFLAPITSLYDGIYRGLKRFKILSIISIAVGIFSISFVYLFIKYYGLTGAILAQNLFYLLLFLVLAINYREFNFRLNKEVMKDITKYSIITGTVSITYFFFTRINTLILGLFGFITQVGYFELSNKFLLIFLIPFNIFVQIISPSITESFSKKEYKNILFRYKRYIFYSSIMNIAIFLFFISVIPLVIKYFLSEYYTKELILSMIILSLSLITQGAGIIASSGFSVATGYAKLNRNFLFFLVPINLLLNILFIRFFGFIAMIISITVIQIIADLLFIYVYYTAIRKKSVQSI